MAQFSPFDIGQIKAHMHHGLGGAAISRILVKADGKSQWTEKACQDAVNKLNSDPSWRGERQQGSGAPRQTTKAQDRQLANAVLNYRGKAKVTINWLRRRFPWTKDFSDGLLEGRLHDAKLKKLPRVKKQIVTSTYIPERIDYCHSTIRKHESTLVLWAYSDGTTFYLDRTSEENEHSQVAALGTHVWRRADGRDSMFKDCLGPSTYKKAQGHPVRIWGVLAEGILHIHILDEKEVMNQELYVELIEDKFEDWLGGCCYLVQDFEKCLRAPQSLKALKRIGVELVEGYPRSSQDFNAIENCWDLLRDRLFATMPKRLENRGEFTARVHQAVQWINRTKKPRLEYLSSNQKERCRDCLATEPPGNRTKW